MRNLLFASLASGLLALAALTPASAVVPAQSGIATAAAEVGDMIAVKRGTWKKRPPGWNRGRKVGWRGGSVPPGQRKKYRR